MNFGTKIDKCEETSNENYPMLSKARLCPEARVEHVEHFALLNVRFSAVVKVLRHNFLANEF